ncbi:MAG: argininosuccinate synthase [Acidobacteriota bacterium]|nr:argininosuccinate synthase [Blastocatellia bacterium]MDW8413044.1 argininosuccinate synthase [Acidobacteriota bacterium]
MIVLAYSGGLDTSVILKWLQKEHEAAVIAYIADVGQKEDIVEIEQRAYRTGAKKVVTLDLKEAFTEYIFAAIQANAVYEGYYLLGTALARPVIAKGMVEVALNSGAQAVCHGATGKGNDQVRFELAVKALAPELKIIAPWREWKFTSRSDLIAYAAAHGIPVSVTADKPYSMDANLMHISYEGGVLEDPWVAPPEEMFRWTRSAEEAPDKPLYLEIDFEQGKPVAIDGKPYSPVSLLEFLNSVAAEHGVGRTDIVENRFIGIKSRGVYETPAVTVLHLAHRAIESLVLDREVTHLKDSLANKFATLVYNGFWFSPEMELLRATIGHTQRHVTGTARVKLYKGSATIVGRKSPYTLYDPQTASFETTSFLPSDAGGFINIHGLRLTSWARQQHLTSKVNSCYPCALTCARSSVG